MSNTKLTRYTQKLFAGSAGTNQLAAFASMVSGTPIYSDNLETLQTSAYTQGWLSAVANNTAPFMQEFNAVQYGFSYQLAYLLQTGLAEWSISETYFTNSYCQYNGNVYKSLVDNNLGNNPSTDDGTNWEQKLFMDIATDAQAAAGLLENVAINPKQLQSDVSNLQSQIDAITAASDVTDIVGNYAQLQAYDTTGLANNSIIKVLQDESRNNETTYYRWVITSGTGAWVLIGEEGPYYTISAANNTFISKNDIATTTTLGTVKIGSGLNVAADGTLSTAAQSTPVTTLASSGTIALTDNSINSIAPTGTITFTLPTITDNTTFHQILVQLDLSTVVSLTLGTSYFFGGEAPDLSEAGYYNLIFEYDSTRQGWVVGAVKKAAA